MEDTKTCIYFFNTVLPQRLNAITVIQVGPTTPCNINATMTVIREASHMVKGLHEIRILRIADAGFPDDWQALDGHFQHVEVRLVDSQIGPMDSLVT